MSEEQVKVDEGKDSKVAVWTQPYVMVQLVIAVVSGFYALFMLKHIASTEFVTAVGQGIVLVPVLVLGAICFIFTGRMFRAVDRFNGLQLVKVRYLEGGVDSYVQDVENGIKYGGSDVDVKHNREVIKNAIMYFANQDHAVHPVDYRAMEPPVEGVERHAAE